jgi:hypothetical protein
MEATMKSRHVIALRALLLVPGLLTLGACGGGDLSRTFGLSRDAPDEFTVTTRAPLSMPPDFDLRPPQPGAPRPQERSDQQQAEAALVPQTALTGTTGSASPGQAALVQQAGPPAPANIRQEVNAEAAQTASDRSLTERLLFWKEPPPPGIVVDPQKEAERLRANAALGRGETSGETPIIQPQSKNIWDGLF